MKSETIRGIDWLREEIDEKRWWMFGCSWKNKEKVNAWKTSAKTNTTKTKKWKTTKTKNNKEMTLIGWYYQWCEGEKNEKSIEEEEIFFLRSCVSLLYYLCLLNKLIERENWERESRKRIVFSLLCTICACWINYWRRIEKANGEREKHPTRYVLCCVCRCYFVCSWSFFLLSCVFVAVLFYYAC